MPLNSLAYNPADATYLTTAPYLSVSEYNTFPTALDTTQLVVGGDTAVQTEALANIISQASSIVNDYCQQVLSASYQRQTQWFLLRQTLPAIQLVCRYKPVLELVGLATGPDPGQLTTVTTTPGAWFNGGVISVPWTDLSSWSNGSVFAEWTYVAGYAHTTLAADAAVGDMSILVNGPGPSQIPVAMNSPTWSYGNAWGYATPGSSSLATNPLGFYPGGQVNIHDGVHTQTVFIAASYTGGPLIPLVQPLRRALVLPLAPDFISVTVVPDAVRQATILLVSAIIKNRGDSSLVLSNVTAPQYSRRGISAAGMSNDEEQARCLLNPFRRAT